MKDIIISNDGGRNPGSAMAPVGVLPGVVNAVEERIPVMVDSGVMRGSDK